MEDGETSSRRDWGIEFAYLNRRRLVWIGAAFLLNVGFVATGFGASSRTILVLYATWLLGICAFELTRRGLRRDTTTLRLAMLAFAWDLVLMTALHLATGGAWWLGAMFYALILTVAAGTLPPRMRGTVALATIVAWLASTIAQGTGWFVPEPWFDLPSLRERPQLFVMLLGLGVVALFAFWNLIVFMGTRIERQQERWRRMVRSFPYAMGIFDGTGRFLEVSYASRAYLGTVRTTGPGLGIMHAVPPEDRERVARAFEEALVGIVSQHDVDLIGDDGIRRHFRVSFAPITADSGESAVLVMAQDVSHERTAAQQRAALERDLAQAQRMELVGRLVSGVAHELNNPLAAILNYSEQLHAEIDDDGVRNDLDVVRTQARRARAIVRDLLHIARGRTERESRVVSLASLVDEAAQVVAARYRERGLRLHRASPPSLPRLSADPTGLVQVLVNLLQNACDASDAGGPVTVTTSFDDVDGWCVVVEDEGSGIPDQALPHLFEPFFTTRAPGEGTGLGLAVSRGIVEQHGGTLRAEQRPEGGARLVMRLPAFRATRTEADAGPVAPVVSVASDRPVAPAAPVAAVVPTEQVIVREATPKMAHDAPRRPTLLLVDDEAPIRLALTRWLERRGAQVVCCANGEEAIERLASAAEFDAIICDLKMPRVTGEGVHRWVAANRPALLERFIIATGDVASPEVARFLSSVNVTLLEKPYELATLDERLADIGVALRTGARADEVAPPDAPASVR